MNSLTEQHFDDGACIIEQGKDNNVFYVMKGGTVSVLQDQGGSPKELAQLTVRFSPPSVALSQRRCARASFATCHGQAGQFFGERALLKDEPANATIKAQGAVTCYICSHRGLYLWFVMRLRFRGQPATIPPLTHKQRN